MAKFLGIANYTSEGVQGLLKDGGSKRRDVLAKAVEALGGTLEAYYFAFGDPDLFVTYHTSTRQEFRADTTGYGYGYPPRWNRYGYWGGVSSSTTRVSSYDMGTLVIDIWDAEDNILVWRGVAQDTVPSSPEKLTNKLDKAIAKMVKQSQEQM